MRTLIIAEAGVNHNGDMSLAHELVQAASESGADIVKFQTFSAAQLVTPSAAKTGYQLATTRKNESQYEMLKNLELSQGMHVELTNLCSQSGIEFLSTAFDLSSLDFLATLGLKRFKVPSGEITNLPYLRQVGSYGKPIILSTGMATLGEIEDALRVLTNSGTALEQITVLHCNTEYPTPMADVNLKAMQTIRNAFGVNIGYSDHTQGIEISIAAAALGATVIEKHITMSKTLPGPDHRSSIEPSELLMLVNAIRNVEQALGSAQKLPSPSEIKNKSIVRKSLVAALPISKGAKFSVENIVAKRPGTGISPMRWDDVIGKVALRDYTQNELID